jgi:hypothetical protein
MHDINTIPELFAALGGKPAVAKWLGLSVGALLNWERHDFIPTGWHLRLYLECCRRDKSVDLRVFGLTLSAHRPVAAH